MYFKTLRLIAELLEDNKEVTENAYRLASKLYKDAIQAETTDAERLEYLKEQKEKAWRRRCEAVEALDDFSDCKFH